MIELRPCESDEDLEAWRHVRIAVVPYELTPSLDDLRRAASPERQMLLAYRDGALAGSGLGGRGDTGGGGAGARVRPEQRRGGGGTGRGLGRVWGARRGADDRASSPATAAATGAS